MRLSKIILFSFLKANLIRQSIKNSFRSTDCHLIPDPIDGGLGGKSRSETLQRLEREKWNDLNESFRSAIVDLCRFITENIQPKSLFKTQVAAPAYAAYIQEVVRQLNSNERVSLVNSFVVGIKYASQKALDDAIRAYTTAMADVQLPTSWLQLDNHHTHIYSRCFDTLQSNLNGENEITKPYLEKYF